MERGGIIVGKSDVLGVAVHAMTAEAIALTHVHLSRRRNSVHVRGLGEATDLAELARERGPRIPVSLVVDTDRCVHRILPRTGEPEELLRQAFPNAPLDELCTSVWQADGCTGLSMTRRGPITDLIARFSEHGFRVVRLSIGPWGLLQLRTLSGNDTEDWSMGGHRFTFTGKTLTAHSRVEAGDGDFQLDADRIPVRHALAFVGAWEHLMPAAERHDRPLPEVVEARAEERARQRYELGLVLAAALLVVLVGSERLAARHLMRSQALLRTSATAHSRDLEAVEALRANVQEMEGIARTLGIGRDHGLARQAAHVAATVPAGIRLERLVEHPLRQALKEREPLEADLGRVRIGGTCPDAGTLDAWMTTLKGTPGIAGVRLLTYTVDAETGLPRFELELGP